MREGKIKTKIYPNRSIQHVAVISILGEVKKSQERLNKKPEKNSYMQCFIVLIDTLMKPHIVNYVIISLRKKVQ